MRPIARRHGPAYESSAQVGFKNHPMVVVAPMHRLNSSASGRLRQRVKVTNRQAHRPAAQRYVGRTDV